MGGKASDPNKAAMRAQKDQMARLNELSVPELEKYVLENPELVGLLEAQNIDPSKMGDITEDQSLRANQMKALEGLSQRADEGITSEDKYAMEQMLGDVAGQEKASQAAIEQEMARKGMDSSGAALMSKLQTKQSGANTARDNAMQMMAQAQQNKMNALSQLGAQSGQMSAQDFNKQAQVKSAEDAIARANAMNRQNVSGQNLAARQGIENQRANIANMNKQVANQIAQQDFQNQYSKTGAQGSVTNSMSQIAANAPQKPGGLQSALGGAATGASVGGSIGGPVGAGYGAAIGAGAGLLSSFEDGGVVNSYEDGGMVAARERDTIAQQNIDNQTKQRDAFKKKYMKQIHDEVLASVDEVTGGDNKPLKDFQNPRTAKDGALFGQPDISRQALMQDQLQGNISQPMPEMFDFNKANADIAKSTQITDGSLVPEKVAGIDIAGMTNDKTNDLEAYSDPKSEGISGEGLSKGLGFLSSLMGNGKQERTPLKLAAYSQPEIKNTLGSLQVPQFKDGGMYASDGMGGVIDSGEESYADDRVDAKVNDGEMVINLPQQQRLMDLLRGEISVDELGSDDIIEGVPREDRDKMHEEGEEDSKMKALMKLIGDM